MKLPERSRRRLLLALSLAAAGLGAQTASPAPAAPKAPAAVPGPATSPAATPAPAPVSASSAAKAPSYASLREELAALPASAEFRRRLEEAASRLPPSESARLLSELGPRVPEPEGRRALLRRAGELFLLLGSFHSAGTELEAAGLLEPRDDLLLLRAARAYLGAGEGQRAGELAALVLASTRDPRIGAQARMAAAWTALLGGSPASARALAATLIPSAESPERAASAGKAPAPGEAEARALAREARFLLWIAGEAEEKATQARLLAAESPGSPEALIAARGGGAALLPLPHWYLGGLAAAAPAARPAGGSLVGGEPASSPRAPGSSPPPPGSGGPQPGAAEAATPAPADSGQPRLFQLGIFSRRENAEALAAELGRKGFGARLEPRKVSGRELLAVVVEAGKDPAATGARLKDSGYEAYPLY